MMRLAMRSVTAEGGFELDRMQREYVDFMTTPGTHDDAYASSYHRMFFARRAQGLPLRDLSVLNGFTMRYPKKRVVGAANVLGVKPLG